jgi:hypothetical protein
MVDFYFGFDQLFANRRAKLARNFAQATGVVLHSQG